MPKSREELVQALERAREDEQRALAVYRKTRTKETAIQHLDSINAMYAAQDALQQWDEDHYGEDS
jgi:hypothetical protein